MVSSHKQTSEFIQEAGKIVSAFSIGLWFGQRTFCFANDYNLLSGRDHFYQIVVVEARAFLHDQTVFDEEMGRLEIAGLDVHMGWDRV